jgi:hypothetical protein
MTRSTHVAALTLVVFASMIAGCGGQGDRPPLGQVTGRVTIGGEPLAGVLVLFHPDSGRMAGGTTDKDGKYELSYTDEAKGCKVGPATIGFAAPTGGSPSHAIPAKYQNKSELKREVKAGAQTFDFELEAEGTVSKGATKAPMAD